MSTAPQYYCQLPGRVTAVRNQPAPAQLNGLEYLEVVAPDQKTLRVFFVLPLPDTGAAGETPPAPAPKLTALNLRIDGGVRVKNIRVTGAITAGNALTITTDARGDFSTYTLRLVRSDVDDTVPAGYDPRLASIEFSFKAACPSEFDCRQDEFCPPETFKEPAIGYLAKDYATFRRLMLDRLSVLLPGWKDRSPADPLVTMVESLAYTADHLSYWQDAVATEAYLGTARKRSSLRRHARLLDYRMHDGCNARTWVHFRIEGNAGVPVPAGTRVLTAGDDPTAIVLADDAALDAALRAEPTVFATLHDVTPDPAHNAIAFHTWSDAQCALPKGATRATLRSDPTAPLLLAAGDWLLLEEVFGPETGLAADADPAHRQVVRLVRADPAIDPLTGETIVEVEWDAADALAFPLCLAQPPGGAVGTQVSVARGNLALADHGLAADPETVALDPVHADRPPRARLSGTDVTFAAPFDAAVFAEEGQQIVLPRAQRTVTTFLTAADALATSAAKALPAVLLVAAGETWAAQRDLLASDRYARDFVVETENDGTAQLRFGDGAHGLKPAADTLFTADYRVGNGAKGNVGADALVRVRTDVAGITLVRNPVAAAGGVDPEPLEQVRQFAPQAFRTQERAVTEADWVEVAQRFPGVQRAAAQFRWTGSWHTVFVTVDRVGGRDVEGDADFLAEFHAHLEQYRLAGYDLEINGPVFVPLDLKLEVCVKPGYFRSDVKAALLAVFAAAVARDGTKGFFHPDNFTFGRSVYLSRIYEAALAVPGVKDLEVVRFRRYGKQAAGELAAGEIKFGPLEVARCDQDPNFPENGRLEIELEGGL